MIWVTWLIYHLIALYLQRGGSPVWQRQWPLNLVRLWVRVKEPIPIGRSRARKTPEVHFTCKNEKFIWSTNFQQIDKTMKKLQWIPNTEVMSTSVPVIFWCLHIWWWQNWFILSRIEKYLTACIRTDHRYYRALQISTVTLSK